VGSGRRVWAGEWGQKSGQESGGREVWFQAEGELTLHPERGSFPRIWWSQW